ncbi:MAG: hypothetical protein HY860_03915 [Chlamydiales bacterium]|nr:hypothetical protein [Chlamydiales bacterium]
MISLFSVFVSSKGMDIIHQYEFNRSINQIAEEIELTKSIAITYQANMVLRMANTDEGVAVQRICYEIPDSSLSLFNTTLIKHLSIRESPIEIIVTNDGMTGDRQIDIVSKNMQASLIIKNNGLFLE